MVHSGSRGYGQSILMDYKSPDGYEADSKEAHDYIEKHQDAILWAERNRLLVARKLIDYLGYSPQAEAIIDCKHNFLEVRENQYIHRKGAVSAEVGPVIVPGSRGSLTYIIVPTDKTATSAYSLSHGAGRKWTRSMCKARIREKYNRDSIRETKLKSKIVCHDTDLLYEEAPEAYKNIDTVIDSLLEYGLIKIVATLKPVLTYKGDQMLIQISSGKGPEECELAVGKFLKVLMKEIQDIKIVHEVKGQYVDCYKSIVFSTEEKVSDLEGTIKWIAQSPFRPKHKRKNWFIDVSIFNENERVTYSEKYVRFETFRCGGNGGQNVNKVETGVRAIHVPTGTTVVSTEARTQHMNKKIALIRLADIINQQNIAIEELAKQAMWLQHELLERGNPIRIYEGLEFKRKK